MVRRADMMIIDAAADMKTFPHAECTEIEPKFSELIGLSVARGYTSAVQERFGRERGCSHLEFLARAIGPAVIQAVTSSLHWQVEQGGAYPGGGRAPYVPHQHVPRVDRGRPGEAEDRRSAGGRGCSVIRRRRWPRSVAASPRAILEEVPSCNSERDARSVSGRRSSGDGDDRGADVGAAPGRDRGVHSASSMRVMTRLARRAPGAARRVRSRSHASQEDADVHGLEDLDAGARAGSAASSGANVSLRFSSSSRVGGVRPSPSPPSTTACRRTRARRIGEISS